MGAKKFWLLLSIIAVIGGLTSLTVVMLRKSAGDLPSASPVKLAFEMETDELDGITVVLPGAEKGSYWELKFVKCTYHKDTGHLENIKGEFFSGKKVLYRISAQTGIIYWKTNVLTLFGNVRFEAGDRDLAADELSWNPGAGKRVITARGQIIFKTPDLTVNAIQINTDPDFKKIVFSGRTKFFFNKQSL